MLGATGSNAMVADDKDGLRAPASPPFQLSSAQNRAVLTVARASPATVLHNVKHWQLLSRRDIGTYSLEVPDRRRIIPTTSGSKASGQTRVEGVMANEQQ